MAFWVEKQKLLFAAQIEKISPCNRSYVKVMQIERETERNMSMIRSCEVAVSVESVRV